VKCLEEVDEAAGTLAVSETSHSDILTRLFSEEGCRLYSRSSPTNGSIDCPHNLYQFLS
jgi:hypothetical protein